MNMMKKEPSSCLQQPGKWARIRSGKAGDGPI